MTPLLLSRELFDDLYEGVEFPRQPSERLRVLFSVWCRRVGYDNVSKLAGLTADDRALLWGLDPDEVVAEALSSGLGATCYPLASAFAAAARTAGFDAECRLAAHGSSPDGHLVVVVSAGSQQFLCDPAFVHLHPAPLSSTHPQRCFVGPPWAPLGVRCAVSDDRSAAVEFTVQRGPSRECRTYTLGAVVTGAEMRDIYERVGRWSAGLVPYVRRLVGDSQVVLDTTSAYIKSRAGLRVVALPVSSEGALRAAVEELAGLPAVGAARVASAITSAREGDAAVAPGGVPAEPSHQEAR